MSEELIKPPGLFDFIESINNHKVDLMTSDEAEKAYDAFMVRRGLSMSLDTVLDASLMNELHGITDYMQYQYLLAKIPKKKRYAKWSKKLPISDDIKFVASYYGVNLQIAERYCKRMTQEQIDILRERKSSGGADKAVKTARKK